MILLSEEAEEVDYKQSQLQNFCQSRKTSCTFSSEAENLKKVLLKAAHQEKLVEQGS